MAKFRFGEQFAHGELMFKNVDVGVGNVKVLRHAVGNSLAKRLFVAVAIQDRKPDAFLFRQFVKPLAIAAFQKGGVNDDAVTGMQDDASQAFQSRIRHFIGFGAIHFGLLFRRRPIGRCEIEQSFSFDITSQSERFMSLNDRFTQCGLPTATDTVRDPDAGCFFECKAVGQVDVLASIPRCALAIARRELTLPRLDVRNQCPNQRSVDQERSKNTK